MKKYYLLLLTQILFIVHGQSQSEKIENEVVAYYKISIEYQYNGPEKLHFFARWDSVKVHLSKHFQYFEGDITMKSKKLDSKGNPLDVPYIDLLQSDDAIKLSWLKSGEVPDSCSIAFGNEIMSQSAANAAFNWIDGYYLPPQLTYYEDDVKIDDDVIKHGYYFEWAFDVRVRNSDKVKPDYLVSTYKRYENIIKKCKSEYPNENCGMIVLDGKMGQPNVRKLKNGNSFRISKTNFAGAEHTVTFEKIGE
ncbi:MAG: hypothetical protein ACOYN5_08810 [Bacteroidales bacterium]